MIRSVRREDFENWRPLWDGYNAFYGRVGSTALPNQVTRTTWARFFETAEPVHALVAEENDELVGLAHYLFHRNTNRVEPVCYLEDLFTVEHRRRRGIGRALIQGVYEEARRSGATRVYWHTQASNDGGRALYDQLAKHAGFIVYGCDL